MIVTLGNLYYYPLKLYVVISSYFYFRKLRVVGIKNIPTKGPLIYAINHQNALLDAFVIHATSWRNPYFLTRGDIFENKFVDKFLRGVKMLPIYRIRDGYNSIKMNKVIFDATKEILNKGGVVGIFPEGSHDLSHRLRSLKKGIARIAFMSESAADFNLNVKVVPIGIQYESYFFPTGRTLVSYGKPISIADYKQTYLEDQNKAFDELLNEVSKRIKSLIFTIESKDYDQVYRTFQSKRVHKKNLKNQLKSDQELVSSLEHGGEFLEQSDKKNFLYQLLENSWYILWDIIGFIPKSLVNIMVKKTIKDPHFYGTMRFAYSMFTYPIIYLILYFLVKYLIF